MNKLLRNSMQIFNLKLISNKLKHKNSQFFPNIKRKMIKRGKLNTLQDLSQLKIAIKKFLKCGLTAFNFQRTCALKSHKFLIYSIVY